MSGKVLTGGPENPGQLTLIKVSGKRSPKKPKDPKRVAAGKKSKRKGSSFERFIVNMFKDAGIDAKRGWWQSGEFARCRGKSKPTVSDILVGDGFEDLWLELGTGAAMDDYKKLDQAERDIKGTNAGNRVPIAVTRRKGQRIVHATLKLQDLLDLTRQLPENEVSDLRVSVRMPELVALMSRIVESSSLD